jgi:hypothetical protein
MVVNARIARQRRRRRLGFGCAILAGAVAMGAILSAPARAQFWEDRNSGSGYYQQAPSRDYFSFPSFNDDRFLRPPQAADSSKAPPPRKLDTPPTSTVVVVGDSLADWLGYGLDETYSDEPDIGVVRKIRPTSGLVRYDPKNETLDWPQAVKDALAAEKPDAIVVMLGLNDRVPLRERVQPPAASQDKGQDKAAQEKGQDKAQEKTQEKTQEKAQEKPQEKGQEKGQDKAQDKSAQDKSAQDKTAEKPAAEPIDTEAPPPEQTAAAPQAPGGSYDFATDKWADLYSKRVDEMIAALKSKGVPVIWVGLPALKGTKSTSDMTYLDEIYRQRAERAGIVYVDIWDGFVDDQGRYVVQGPDFEGQIRRLRSSDGVHFTKAGAVKLASYVDRELRRIMTNRAVPVALPGPEQTAPKPAGPGPRPDVGPVIVLTVGAGETGGLLGADGRAAPLTPDPVAAKVLSRGDALAAPAGRADDFSWPRRADDAATADLAPAPAALAPGAAAKKGAASANGKGKTAPDPAAARGRRSPSADLDGTLRPPKTAGGGF